MKLSWQHVILVLIIVAGMLGMAKIDPAHTDAFILFGLGVLAAVGLVHTGNQLGEIKNATNGTNSRVISLLERQSEQMAKLSTSVATPPPAVDSSATLVDSDPTGH